MAGDWIKMRSNLRRHPKVVRMASALNADRLRIVGALHAVWCLFDEHSEDGQLLGYTLSAVDDEIGFPGFARCMEGVGWLIGDGTDTLSLPEFDTHNGASAKRRAQEADRKRAEREALKDHPQDDRKPSALDADTSVTREEKRREEKKEEKDKGEAPRKRVTLARPDDVSESVWDDWLLLRKTKKAPATETVLREAIAEAAKANVTLQRFLEIWCMRGSQGLKAEWLRADEQRPLGAAPLNKQEALEARNHEVGQRFLANRERQDAQS